MRARTVRHIIHLAGGSVPPLSALILPRDWLLLFWGVVAGIFVFFETLRFLVAPVNRWLMSLFSGISAGFKAGEAVRPIGSTYLVTAAFLTLLLFSRDTAVTALFFAAVGDPAAAAVGERFGKTKVGNKSLEGAGACFAAAAAVGAILLWFGLQLNWIAIFAGAFVTALIELLPIPIDDNFTVPLVSAAVISLAL